MTDEDLEMICLEIMSQGEDMPAIGNWKKILEGVAAKGWAKSVGADYRITDEGRAEMERRTEAEMGVRTAPPTIDGSPAEEGEENAAADA